MFACSVKKPANRIIALAPNLAALVSQAGALDKLVGVSVDTPYKNLPIVASYHGLDLEKIISLKPDLVVAWKSGNPQSELNKLKAMHIRVLEFSFLHLSDIPAALKKIGCLAGTASVANEAARQFDEAIASMKRKYSNREPLRVFYQIWSEPVTTVSQHSLISQVISLCGGVNIFAKAPGSAPVVDMETVIRRNPQAMLGDYRGWQEMWRSWHSVDAIRYNNVFTIGANSLQQPDMKILLGIKQVCEDLALARRRSLR